MTYRPLGFNETPQIPEKGIKWKRDAIFLRNKYQTEVNNAWVTVLNMSHHVEDENQKIKESYNKALGIKKDIEAHQSERADLYSSLQNLLSKETDFEKEMLNITKKESKIKSVTIKNKFKDSDIDEIKYNAMHEFIDKYPEYASKSSFRTVLSKIQDKEREIREAKHNYHKAVSEYNYLVSFMEKNLQKVEDKIDAYKEILKEAYEKLNNTKYKKSIFYKMASERTKHNVSIITLTHRLTQVVNTMTMTKDEFKNLKRKNFEEMEY